MHATLSQIRPGERQASRDAADADDARLVFIGRVASTWSFRAECPKNMREARERGPSAAVAIASEFREALSSLVPGAFVHLLTWLHESRRDLSLQVPRHSAEPRGTFSLRSPVRPNPIGLHLVRIVTLDIGTGHLGIDAIDAVDGTPVLDIKPYFHTVDRPPESDGRHGPS